MTESEIRKLLEEVEQYSSKATPGPLRLDDEHQVVRAAAGAILYDQSCDERENWPDADAMFVLRARTDLPKLAALLREKLEGERWIPVSERLPEKDGKYLCWHADEIPVISYFTGYTFWNDGEAQDVTHWRPLPAAPEVQA